MAKHTGFQVKLHRETAVPGTFAEIAQITSVTPPQYSRETIDVTDKDSAGYREFLGGLVDAGEVSCEVNYDPAIHNVLLDDLDSDDPVNWQVNFPTTPVQTCTFSALLTGFAATAPMEDKMAATITMKVSGKPAWA